MNPMSNNIKMATENMSFYYGDFKAIDNITLGFRENYVTALIGPSGCGKSTYIRTLNRMNDIIPGTRVEGKVLLDGENIYASSVDVVEIRKRVGMVFQKPNPFPKTIFNDVAYGLRLKGIKNRSELQDRV